MKPTRNPPRNTHTLQSLVRQLRRDVPGFKDEDEAVQAELAAIVWAGDQRRQHAVHEGYMRFTQKELAERFGRGKFDAINQRLGFLDVNDTYQFFSKDKEDTDTKAKFAKGYTKGYRFTRVVQASRDRYMARKPERMRALDRLLDANLKPIGKAQKAIASQDAREVSTSRWKAINKAGNLELVRVNLKALLALRDALRKTINAWERKATRLSDANPLMTRDEALALAKPRDLLMEYPSLKYLKRLQERTAQVIAMAHIADAGRRNVRHRYVESDSGRLFAQGAGNLASAPGAVRKTALMGMGMWDYDVENCHFAIIAEMARRAGHECVAIKGYLADKDKIRASIAETIGISINRAKKCLLAVMYGARTTEWEKNAIPEAIGKEKAALLYKLPLFADVAADVKLARNAILAKAPLNRQGNLPNAFGKAIRLEAKGKEKAKTPEQRLAHLTQGIEALALKACTDLSPHDIILLQHDGFTASKPLNVKALESAIETATGYKLTLEEAPVRPDVAGQFGKARDDEFSKAQKALKRNAGAGLRRVPTTLVEC